MICSRGVPSITQYAGHGSGGGYGSGGDGHLRSQILENKQHSQHSISDLHRSFLRKVNFSLAETKYAGHTQGGGDGSGGNRLRGQRALSYYDHAKQKAQRSLDIAFSRQDTIAPAITKSDQQSMSSLRRQSWVTGRNLLASELRIPLAALVDHEHWLCGRGKFLQHNNTASYGACIATVYHHLEILGLPNSATPGYAGVTMQLRVLKLDAYGQTVKSDSSSSLQLRSALSGDTNTDDPSISFEGTLFSVFQEGVATFRIAVKPTFSIVSISESRAVLLRQPFLYMTGTDSGAALPMQTEIPRVHLAQGNQTICPPGSVLIIDSAAGSGPGACTSCPVGKYNVNPMTGLCLKCPPSAMCIKGAPPIFEAVTMKGTIILNLPDDSSDDIIRQALASKLGVGVWQVAVLPAQGNQRRSTQRIQFEVVVANAHMDELESKFITMGAVLSSSTFLGSQVAEGEVWEEMDGQFILRRCPPGNMLVNTTTNGDFDVDVQQCTPCGEKMYIVEGSTRCVNYPKGANSRDGSHFESIVDGAKWIIDESPEEDGVLVRRIVECPAGYALERIESYPQVDNCVACPGTSSFGYSLVPAQWNGTSMATGMSEFCEPCPVGASCVGEPTLVTSNPGWWLVEENDHHQDQRRGSVNVKRIWRTYRCDPGGFRTVVVLTQRKKFLLE